MRQRPERPDPALTRLGPSRRACLLAAAAVGAGLVVSAPALGSAEIGTVPQWPSMRLLDGTTLAPASWVGQPSVVVFWATWCPFCKRHNVHVDKLARDTAGRRLRVLGIALDIDEQVVRRYMAANRYQFAVTLDGGGLRQQLGLRSVIPMTCVFDRQGRLTQALGGEMFEEDVMDLAKLAGNTSS